MIWLESNTEERSLWCPQPHHFLVVNVLITPSLLTSKYMYWQFIDRSIKLMPTSQKRWMEIYNLTDMEWASVYKLSFICSIETKLQAFQFSILHRFVPHKHLLFKMGLVESDFVSFAQKLILSSQVL